MGVLRDATGDYSAALALCLALDLGAAGLIVAGRRRPRIDPARPEWLES
jgi:hypothetical protein